MICSDYRLKDPFISCDERSRKFAFPFLLPEPGNMGQAILSLRDDPPSVVNGEETALTEEFFIPKASAAVRVPMTEIDARLAGYASLAEAASPQPGCSDVRICFTSSADDVASRCWILIEESAKDHTRQLAGRRMAAAVVTAGSILLGKRPGLEDSPTFTPTERAKAALTMANYGFPQGVGVTLWPAAVLCAEKTPCQLDRLVCNY